MSGREWQPGDGDFAFISWKSQSGRSGGSGIALRCSRAYNESHWQTQTFGEIPDHKVTDIRPLVVIDPEDREQVERLRASLEGMSFSPWACGAATCLTTALREFANPTPPKPDEPTGLGAVVEDRDGIRWVRSLRADVEFSTPWRDCNDDHFARHYDAIAAVRVLSEGVTP